MSDYDHHFSSEVRADALEAEVTRLLSDIKLVADLLEPMAGVAYGRNIAVSAAYAYLRMTYEASSTPRAT
ncbi:MAG: hypothetical protein LC687_00535 [Actinobacteria bacterium]|nr:hypothetical protein [Actinomycetota bacterium]MCA1806354.1 hypothetical protein [Actinomycetota bacterium]